jgi:hypothetical protein
MKKSNENLIPVDFSPVDEQYRQLSDNFRVNIFQTYFSPILLFIFPRKSMNKLLIGKNNSLNIPNYGKIFINVYNIYKNGSIKPKLSSAKNMMIMLISFVNIKIFFKPSTMIFYLVLPNPDVIYYIFERKMNRKNFNFSSIHSKQNGNSLSVMLQYVYYVYNLNVLKISLLKN